MRAGIVDNSTLTACQRLLGDIKVANVYNIDGDIAAFETLIQAILFCDRLFYLDDYKPEYRAGRAARFPFISPLDLTSTKRSQLGDAADTITNDLIIRVEAGDITTIAVREFLEQMNMHVLFAWHMASSDFLLNVRMLGGANFDSERCSKIAAMISSQQHGIARSGALPNEDITLIGSDGSDVRSPHTREGKRFYVGADVIEFAKNINWLCYRTAVYSLLAATTNSIAILHPVRSSFSLSLAASKLGLPDILRRRIIESLKSSAEKTLAEIKSASDPTAVNVQLPFFTAWIASKGAPPSQFFAEALRLKENRHIVALRSQLSALEDIDAGGNVKKYVRDVNHLVECIVSASATVRSEFAITTANGPSLSPLVAVANAGLASQGIQVPIPELGLKLPSSLGNAWKNRGYRGVFRSVIADLASVAKLGSLHEKITRDVQCVKDAQFKEVKVEPPELRYAKPYWKRPM